MVIHYEEALYQVYMHLYLLPFTFNSCSSAALRPFDDLRYARMCLRLMGQRPVLRNCDLNDL